MSIRSVRTIVVERSLRGLQPVDGIPLANTTKTKIRILLSVLFNHAIRYEWLGQGGNPITLVRQSAKRMRTPEVLEPSEIQNLLLQLKSCFRLMILLDVTTGLRRSELFALKWSDVDFSNMCLDVCAPFIWDMSGTARRKHRASRCFWMIAWPRNSGCGKRPAGIGNPTTGYSQAPVARGSNRSGQTYCCKRLFGQRHCAPGSTRKLGGIPFDTFSTLLIGNGENVKVVQELMRHASSRCTLEVYSQARLLAKRHAQQRVVQMIIPKEAAAPEPVLTCESQIMDDVRTRLEVNGDRGSRETSMPRFTS